MTSTALSPEQVAEADTASLVAAARACDALSGLLAARTAALTESRGRGRAGWHGIAADRAQLVLVLERGRLHAAAEQFQALASVLVRTAEELRPVRAEVRAVLAEARAAGCLVRGAEVSGGSGAGPLAARLAAALAAAGRADARCAAALAGSAGQARSGEGLDPAVGRSALLAAAALVGAGLPGPGSSPARVHDWWLRLDPDERRMLLRDQPQLVGSLDGVPASVRDRANRTLLDQLLAYQSDALPNQGLLAIRDRLDRQRGASPPALLLSLGLEGQGRAVLSFGDPDRADRVCVYVPGMGTRLADVGGKDGDRALAVHDAAGAADPGARPGATAAMVWLGYDAPQSLAEVAADGRAAAGAAPYDRFVAGLRATHAGPPARITALGHSYGSLLVGLAARRPGGTGADGIVLIGSPGAGVSHASELGVDPARVWVGAAADDPVSSLLPGPPRSAAEAVGAVLTGALPPLRTPVPPVLQEHHRVWFGADPAAPAFGARRLPVDTGRGPGGGFTGAHSHYLDRGSGSLAAIGRIVAGKQP
ncbi:alpha/beta hydrolase [Streptacidiphilus sp. N1-12]|uniref:Alpha/beta hydrolase n=2 Tax=Streptacidiphilus alkalitolerans TaxID=3342712 RepID=A0ABV6WPD2_9ACTN